MSTNTHLRGIGCIIVSGFLLAINDSIYKSLVSHYPAGQILFCNGALVSLVLWFYLRFGTRSGVVVNSWFAHILRGLLFLVASFAFVISLQHLPLAEVICIAFAGPLCMTLMGKWILGEQVGIYRLFAVVAGFIGVLIIIQPGGTNFKWILLLPLVVALGDAGRDILTRKMAPNEDSLCIVFTTSMVMALGSLMSVFWGWNEWQLDHMLRFFLSVFITIGSYFFMVEAYRNAPTVVIAPFRYIQIIWGILAGIVVWGEIPRSSVYIGIALLVSAGVFIAIREGRAEIKK